MNPRSLLHISKRKRIMSIRLFCLVATCSLSAILTAEVEAQFDQDCFCHQQTLWGPNPDGSWANYTYHYKYTTDMCEQNYLAGATIMDGPRVLSPQQFCPTDGGNCNCTPSLAPAKDGDGDQGKKVNSAGVTPLKSLLDTFPVDPDGDAANELEILPPDILPGFNISRWNFVIVRAGGNTYFFKVWILEKDRMGQTRQVGYGVQIRPMSEIEFDRYSHKILFAKFRDQVRRIEEEYANFDLFKIQFGATNYLVRTEVIAKE